MVGPKSVGTGMSILVDGHVFESHLHI